MSGTNENYTFLTEQEYNTLIEVLNGYIDYDGEVFCDKCFEAKYDLDKKVCELDLWRANEYNYSEIKLGNTYIENDVLTCIFDNAIHKFKMVNRKADKGDLAFITGHSLAGDKYIGHCFRVYERTTNDGWSKECAVVRINDAEHQGWCLYDGQYIVLEEIK